MTIGWKCPVCQGARKVFDRLGDGIEDCPKCHGTGSVTTPPVSTDVLEHSEEDDE